MILDALASTNRKIGFVRLTTGAMVVVGVFIIFAAAKAAAAGNTTSLGIEAQASHTLVPGDSKPLARKLALFRAKRKAANRAADRFTERGLIQFVDRDKNELVSLVADRLDAEILRDRCKTEGPDVTCTVQVHALIRLSDFIDAQLASLRLGAQEKADFHEEMEPEVAAPFRPGRALAKAYRLIHKKEWRMAIIYLDRVTQRYPNWREAYEVKAVALKFENQFSAMQEALQRACELGGSMACAELRQRQSMHHLKGKGQ